MNFRKTLHFINAPFRITANAIGPVATAFMYTGVVMYAIAFLSTSGFLNTADQNLIHEARSQHTRIVQMSRSAQHIELAVRTEEWNEVEPALEALHSSYNELHRTHSSLKNGYGSTYTHPVSGESIAGLLARFSVLLSPIESSIRELELVGSSVVRRAPYIDTPTLDRLVSAVDEIHEGAKLSEPILFEVTQMTELRSLGRAEQKIKSIHGWMLYATLMCVGAFLFGINPKLNRLRAKLKSISEEHEESASTTNACWTMLESIGIASRDESISKELAEIGSHFSDLSLVQRNPRMIERSSVSLAEFIDSIESTTGLSIRKSIDVPTLTLTTDPRLVSIAIQTLTQSMTDPGELVIETHTNETKVSLQIGTHAHSWSNAVRDSICPPESGGSHRPLSSERDAYQILCATLSRSFLTALGASVLTPESGDAGQWVTVTFEHDGLGSANIPIEPEESTDPALSEAA